MNARMMGIFIVMLILSNFSITGSINGMGSIGNDRSSMQVEKSKYDLLIITPEKFSIDLQPLVEHKDNYGVRTKLMTLEEIYVDCQGRDKPEQIKYCIKDAIEKWEIKYVLLVGGRKPSLSSEKWLLPVRYSHIEDNVATMENSYISDLYYADIYDANGNFSSWDTNNNGIFGEWLSNRSADGIIDLKPDVYVGRLPCRNKFEVRIMVNKIINYEKTSGSWFKRMVVVGGDTYTFNDYYEGEVSTQKALDQMPGFEPVKLWASDGSLSGWTDVIKAINRGCGFLYFSGHGSPTGWATHPPKDNKTWIYGLQIFQMPLLSNGDKLPVCIVGGCHNSMFNITLYSSIFKSKWTYHMP